MANGHSTVETFLKRIFSLQFLGFVVSVIATIIGLLTLLRENGGELTFKVDNVVLKNNAGSNYFVITSNDSVDLIHYISLTPTVVNDSKYAAKGISLSATIEGQGCHLLQNKNFSASETEGENTYSYNSSELFAHNVVPQIFKSAKVDKYGGEFTITTKCSCEGMDQLFVYTANVKVVNLSKTYFDSEALLKEHVRQELKGNTSFTTFNLVVINGDSCYRYNNLTADLLLQDAPAKQAASVDTTQVQQEETVEEEAGSWYGKAYNTIISGFKYIRNPDEGHAGDIFIGALYISLPILFLIIVFIFPWLVASDYKEYIKRCHYSWERVSYMSFFKDAIIGAINEEGGGVWGLLKILFYLTVSTYGISFLIFILGAIVYAIIA